jgi:hypothetical protein
VATMLIMAVVMVVVSVVLVTAVIAMLGHSPAYYTPIGYLTSDGFDPRVTEPTGYRRYAFAASISSWAAFDCSLVG